MPSAFAHAAPALALVPAFARPGTPKRLWLLGVACALAPDLDVVAFSLGVPYAHPLGHRGLWHSVPFAAVASALVALLAFPRARAGFSRPRAWLYLFLAMASHGVLDAFTDGGLGIALLAPFDPTRHFFSFRPIAVSPLGAAAFFSPRGLRVLPSELAWVWLPSSLLGAALLSLRALARRRRRGRPAAAG